MILEGVDELTEGLPVELTLDGDGTLVIEAFNEGGCNCTMINFVQLREWMLTHGCNVVVSRRER